MEDRKDPVFFSEWLKRRRRMLDLTQEELAQRTGCSVFALRKIESGERRPSKQLAGLLAEALGIPKEDQLAFIRIARRELNLERLEHLPLEHPVPLPGPQLFPEIDRKKPIPEPHTQVGKTRSDSYPTQRPDSQPLSTQIPLQVTPLIGRETEYSAMERRLSDPECRLLTLTGIGGIGKTRLAQEFGVRQKPAFPGGVFYFPLTAVNSAEKITGAMAEILDFVFSGPAAPEEQLLNYIANSFEQPALFILDNLEHLLAPPTSPSSNLGLVDLVCQILCRSAHIKILGTSRERLNVQGEWTYELHGLSTPPAEYASQVEQYNAVAFFIHCAKRIQSGFHLSDAEQSAVVRICRVVEGVPLAIELAAAWVGVLSCQDIAAEIQANMDFLTTMMRDVPERHRSLRATFDHSWKLLSDEERQALSQLSVFHGGFTRQAASQVAGASLSLLASLVDKSLVVRSEHGRYDLHEVIRQYTLAHLQNDTRSSQTFQRHSEYYLSFLSDREKSLKCAQQQAALHQLNEEIDNILAAWEWAIKHRQFSWLGQAGRAFGWYFEISSLYREGIEQLELLVQAAKVDPHDTTSRRVLGLALVHQALLYFRKGEFGQAERLYEESLAVLRPIGAPGLMADGLVFLGIILHMRGDYKRSKALSEEGLLFAREAGQPWIEALAIFNNGYTSTLIGDLDEGYEQMAVSLEIWRGLGDPHAIAMGLNFLAPVLIKLGRYEQAILFMEESIALCEQSKNRWGMGTAYRFLGLATMASGRYHEAQAHFHRSLEVFGEQFIGWDIAKTLTYLGDATLASGDLPGSRKTYQDALRLANQIEAPPIALDALLGLGLAHKNSGNLFPALVIFNFVLMDSCSEQETGCRASRLCAELERTLPQEQVISARSLAQALNIETLIENIPGLKAES